MLKTLAQPTHLSPKNFRSSRPRKLQIKTTVLTGLKCHHIFSDFSRNIFVGRMIIFRPTTGRVSKRGPSAIASVSPHRAHTHFRRIEKNSYSYQVMPRYPPPKKTLQTVTKKWPDGALSGFRMHEAPHTSDSGKFDSIRKSSKLLGMLDLTHSGSHIDWILKSSTSSLGGWGGEATAASFQHIETNMSNDPTLLPPADRIGCGGLDIQNDKTRVLQ